MAKIGWFCVPSVTKSAILTIVNIKNPRFLCPKTQVLYRYYRSKSKINRTLSFPSCNEVMENIILTDQEMKIFDQLVRVLRHFKLETQLRVAGGWVRDKLLGKECYDIDIALDNMLGRDFCEKVNDYLISTGEKTQGIGVIQSNPGKETATMRLFDVWIDFVHLRSEDYAVESSMRFGTVEQDAFRRDLTINSLFYNINTCSVEDFTGRGLDDLKCGKIATPLPPKQTFLDDPLRVLRAIRFSARFGFEMVEDLKLAANDNDVKSAIADKISRERIGHEIDLMVSGNQPVKAIACISELGLFWVVFILPSIYEPRITEEYAEICVGYIDAAWRFLHALGGCTLNDEQRRLYLYAALFLPFKKTVYGDNKKKTVSPSAVNHVFKNSLKLKTRDADNVIKLHNAAEKFSSLIPYMVSSRGMKSVEVDWKPDIIDVHVSLKLRISMGLLLREIKDLWRAALMLSILLNKDYFGESIVDKIQVFEKVEEEILKLNLDKVWEGNPLINGRDIMKLLELKNGGPAVSEWQRKLIQWQLVYPSGNLQECIDWMTRQKTVESLSKK